MAQLESCIVVGQNPPLRYKGIMRHYDIGERTGKSYAAFYNIPYAQNPERGIKRFQAPKPNLTRATLTYRADVKGTVLCSQYLHSKDQLSTFIGSSNCLYLNVYVPEKPDLIVEHLPVLVYVHGGGFFYGNNSYEIYTPDSIIQHGLVFVTINYRLGLFGFLNLRTKDCPGNAGLKDQVRALEWIRDNIACFKGDPNNVTLSGHSAGATCVNLHLISPMSKDLFHKAIVQSGGVHCPFGYRGHRREIKRILIGDPKFRQLSDELLDGHHLHEYVISLLQTDRQRRHPRSYSPLLGPTTEKFREGAFMADGLEEMMKNVHHDKPIMAGIVKEEGIVPFFINTGIEHTVCINDDHEFLQFLKDNFRWSDETAEKLIDEIRDEYFPGRFEFTESEKRIHFVNFIRDVFFRRFYDQFKFGPDKRVPKNFYVYQFEHFSEICQSSYLEIDPAFTEPTHGDELPYLYCSESLKKDYKSLIYDGPDQNTEIQEVMNHMCSLWANFCKTGVPKSDFDTEKVEWRRHTDDNPCYLSISANLELKEGALFQKEWAWLNERVNVQPTVDSLASTPEETDEE